MTVIVPSLPLIRVNGGVNTDEDFDQLYIEFTLLDFATPVSVSGITFTSKVGSFATLSTGSGSILIDGTYTNIVQFQVFAAAKATWPVGVWPINLLATDGTYTQEVFAPNSTIQVGGSAAWRGSPVRWTSIFAQFEQGPFTPPTPPPLIGSCCCELLGQGITMNAPMGPTPLPANGVILFGIFRETAGHAVEISLGTTLGASDIMPMQLIPANGVVPVEVTAFLKTWFAAGLTQTIYVTSASWGGASINLGIQYGMVP